MFSVLRLSGHRVTFHLSVVMLYCFDCNWQRAENVYEEIKGYLIIKIALNQRNKNNNPYNTQSRFEENWVITSFFSFSVSKLIDWLDRALHRIGNIWTMQRRCKLNKCDYNNCHHSCIDSGVCQCMLQQEAWTT